MARYVVLLRGINVGRAKRIGMADLRSLCEREGFEQVRSQGQSGNLILDSSLAARTVATRLAQAVQSELGMEVGVVVRTAAELRAVLKRNPFREIADPPRNSSVSFLDADPAADALEGIEPDEFAPEQFVLEGKELYLWLPRGQTDSPLRKALSEKRLGTAVTNRNWNTLAKLG
ncbi:MAG TPA: DUF1697 domain-containing protein, partial [Gaiellales bacterium]|nr:DUF1697 domain-containing protein [Gaiellales bacterium]